MLFEFEEIDMTKTLYGTVHGNTIKLDGTSIAEGQEVEVQVKIIPIGIKKPAMSFLCLREPWPTMTNGRHHGRDISLNTG